MKPQASPKIHRPEAEAEPDLIVRARNGDPEAFATLYNEHHGDVARYLRSRVRDQHTAEDLTQEVFLRALRRMSTFSGHGFGPWLGTIARNIAIDHSRSSRVRLEVPVDAVGEGHQVAASAEDSALHEIGRVDTAAHIAAAMTTLTVPQQQCLRLRYLENQSISETATATGRTVGGVKTMTYRAVQGMGRALRSAGMVTAA
ncbi:RNA polymerase sigma factor [Streptomyces sp. NPDC055078]